MTLPLDPGHKQIGAHFNRFGIITTHIDGSGQTVYFDDLTYTIGTQPSLAIAKTAPAEATLEWPTNYTGFMVESVLSLGAGSPWSPLPNAITINGAVFRVSIGTTNATQFFRLRKP